MYFDVRDFGASGDGTADDTASIEGALDAAMESGGGTVVFPTGTYRVTNELEGTE
jgi:polygalacturonase